MGLNCKKPVAMSLVIATGKGQSPERAARVTDCITNVREAIAL